MSERSFHLFAYGTLLRDGGATLLVNCERVMAAAVAGTLYDIRGEYPALILYGQSHVRGEVWRCPTDVLHRLDEYEGVASGLFRRAAVDVGGIPCWTYVAGPKLARELTPSRRIDAESWQQRSPNLDSPFPFPAPAPVP